MTSTLTPPPTANRLRWAVLALVLAAEVMDLIDATIVTVAAPSIRADLGGSAATLQWLTAAYTLAFAVLLITGARLGDIFGRRRLFIVGIAGFTAASVVCAAAQTPGMLIATRAVQGAFGALLIPQGFGMIKEVFSEEEITKAFAAFGPVMGLSAVAAPIIGGGLVDADLLGSGWRSIFLVNLPLGLVGLIGAIRIMPRSVAKQGSRLDPFGALLASAAAFAVIYPLVQGRELGWPLWCFALLAAGVAGFAAFARYERRAHGTPLIEPSLLRNATYRSGLVTAVCFFAAMAGLMLVISLFCQLGEHFSPLRTGLTIAPFAIGMVVTAPLSYPLAKRFGRLSMQVGFVVMAAGFVLLALLVDRGHSVSSWALVPGEFVAGLGMGMAIPVMFDFILAGVTGEEVGSASGVLNAVQQFGSAFGVAAVATVFFALLDHHHTPTSAMGITTLLSISLLGLAGLSVFRLPQQAREGAAEG